MRKNFGILALLILICAATAWRNPDFLKAYNVENTLRWTGLFGLLGFGAGIVILTGGIDLSIGAVVGLTGTLLPWLLARHGWPLAAALPATMLAAVAVGALQGALVAWVRLQPFLVTLCGLLAVRGLARWFSGDATQGFGSGYAGLKSLASGKVFALPVPGLADAGSIAVPAPFLIMVLVALLLAVFLHLHVGGRYLFALGRNEEAARFSGIRTARWTLLAYVVSATLAGMTGILLALDLNSVQPAAHGNFYELYAIAAAVLGGCSLRGGEMSVLGVMLGTAILRVLYNAINILGVPTQLEFAVVGLVILAGALVDEGVRRLANRA